MNTIAVYGAYGHTAGFVVTDLRRRGFELVLSGRDATRLEAAAFPGAVLRPASLDSPSELARVLDGVDAVVNCAGPFGDTPSPLLEAALSAHVHYLDVAGEALVTLSTFAGCRPPSGVVVAPALGFFGALGDLLATVALSDWPAADEVTVAFALDSWAPTPGTVRTGELRAGRRVVFENGQLDVLRGDTPQPTGVWTFPEPFGAQPVVGEFITADVVTIPRHVPVGAVRAYVHTAGASDPGASPGTQAFVVDVVVRRGGEERRAAAAGRDIYAISAPLVGEATRRVLDGRAHATGLITAGQAFDAEDFLRTLPLDRLVLRPA